MQGVNLEYPRSIDYTIHRNSHVAFIVYALSVTDQQDLGGFVVYIKGVGHFIGDRAITDEVQVVKIDIGGGLGSFQPVFYQGAGGAAGAMFKNELGAVGGSFPDLFQLGLVV